MIHHVGYVVEDLRAGIERFARDFGAGPFFVIEHIAFDEVTFEGAPAVYDHSSAFGAWGPILVELTQVHDAQPAGLADALTRPARHRPRRLAGRRPRGRDRAAGGRRDARLPHRPHRPGVGRLVRRGGPFGHPVEVLQRCPELLAFYADRLPMTDVTVIGFGARGRERGDRRARRGRARDRARARSRYGGGNALNAGGFLFDVDGPHAVDHLEALCFGKTPRDVLEATPTGCTRCPRGWSRSAARREPSATCRRRGRTSPATHLPPVRRRPPGPRCSTACARAVEAPRHRGPLREPASPSSRSGNVDPRRRRLRVRRGAARRATCRSRSIAVGHPGNTGDAVCASPRQAGASLWHMSAFFGWFAFRHPDHVAAFPLDVHAPSFIHVDADGRRFADETGWEVHDKLRCLDHVPAAPPQPPAHARLPGLRRARAARRPAQRHRRHAQRLRLERRQLGRAGHGWIRPLARSTPAPRRRRSREYGATPDEFGRAPDTIVPLEPPLYAIEIWPGRGDRLRRPAPRRPGARPETRRHADRRPLRRRRAARSGAT